MTVILRLSTALWWTLWIHCIPVNLFSCSHCVLSLVTLLGSAKGRSRRQCSIYSYIPNNRVQICTGIVWEKMSCSKYWAKTMKNVLKMFYYPGLHALRQYVKLFFPIDTVDLQSFYRYFWWSRSTHMLLIEGNHNQVDGEPNIRANADQVCLSIWRTIM